MSVIMQSLIYLAAEGTDKTPNQNWKLYGERTAYAQYLILSYKTTYNYCNYYIHIYPA